MLSFITGSRVYGSPTEDSDIDLVVSVSLDDLEILDRLKDKEPIGVLTEKTNYAIRYGRLNIIPLTETDAQAWFEATRQLKAMRPVTRELAVETIKAAVQKARTNG